MKIISGGQTGVDRGALDAALATGTPCGGWCPAGRKAEDGVIPARYPVREMESPDYAARTRQNILDSDATLLIHFGELEGGTRLTHELCRQLGKPCLVLDMTRGDPGQAVAKITAFVRKQHVRVLNVAGPRASKVPRAAAETGRLLQRLLAETA